MEAIITLVFIATILIIGCAVWVYATIMHGYQIAILRLLSTKTARRKGCPAIVACGLLATLEDIDISFSKFLWLCKMMEYYDLISIHGNQDEPDPDGYGILLITRKGRETLETYRIEREEENVSTEA